MALPEHGDDAPLRPLGAGPRRMPVKEVLSRSAHWQRAAAFAMLCSAYGALWSLGFFLFAAEPPVGRLWDALAAHLTAIPVCGAAALWRARAERRSRL